MQKSDGMNYAPEGKAEPVCGKGDFPFAAVGLDHGHINGMCNGLVEAGAELRWVFDRDPAKAAEFCERFPGSQVADGPEQALEDESIKLIASATIPSERGPLGLRVMDCGKDYFSDKAPFTSLDQLEGARSKVAETGLKHLVYYSERLHVECAIRAGDLIQAGAIGRVIQVLGLGPHRLRIETRPDWFFQKKFYGGILCDIGSHQIEQFLFFSGAKDATVRCSNVANFQHKDHPELEDYGDATLVADNGAVNYFRVDWFTPDGLGTWGDGRTVILGTEGYIELRKYCDVARDGDGDQLYLVNGTEEQHVSLKGQVGYPYFGRLILDCLHRTDTAMGQEHAFKAAELCLIAQRDANRIE